MKRLLLIMVAAFGLFTGSARAEGEVFNLIADAESDTGYVLVGVVASTSLTDITYGELFNDTTENPRPLPVEAFPGAFTEHGGLSGGKVPRAFPWRCDRTDRTFVATATTQDGRQLQSTFQVRTPSCRNRLTVTIPQQAEGGDAVKVSVLDRWEIGNVTASVCREVEGLLTRCDDIVLPKGKARGVSTFRPEVDDYWTVTVRGPLQRTQRTVAVGVKPRAKDLAALPQILATGDSLMQGLDGLLEDRIGSAANLNSDVLIGSGLTSDLQADWSKVPGRQRRMFKPDATVLFLGANDSYEMNGVGCCGDVWGAEYERRARKLMKTYTKGGSSMFYLTVPIARDPDRNVPGAAVNAAIVRAQRGVPRVHIIDVGKVLTPGGVFREEGVIDGETVDIYQDDGIHLSFQAARIISDIVIDSFTRRGIVR